MGAWPHPYVRRAQRGRRAVQATFRGAPRRAARPPAEAKSAITERRDAGRQAGPRRVTLSEAAVTCLGPQPLARPRRRSDSTVVNRVPGSARPPGGRNKAFPARAMAIGEAGGTRRAQSNCSFMGRGSDAALSAA